MEEWNNLNWEIEYYIRTEGYRIVSSRLLRLLSSTHPTILSIAIVLHYSGQVLPRAIRFSGKCYSWDLRLFTQRKNETAEKIWDFNLCRCSKLYWKSPWASCSNFEFVSSFEITPALCVGFDQTLPKSLLTSIMILLLGVTRAARSVHEQCLCSTGLACPICFWVSATSHLVELASVLLRTGTIGSTVKKSGWFIINF